jgi:nucleoside-diphosphate-sugar epimerase
MRIFVTGASGWVGSALVPELMSDGHDVVGLARSDASAAVLTSVGAEVQRGALEDLDTLRDAAVKSDAVIHLAFIHDFARYDAANEADREAIAAMGEALEGSERPLIVASGVATTARDRAATENDPADPGFPRSRASDMTLALAEHGVRAGVVRLPPTVHGEGDEGFIAMLIQLARDKGVSGYVGEGSNVWPAVHRSDAASVFRRAVERGRAGGVYHAVAEEGVPTRAIAEAIGRHLGVPVVSIAPEDAASHFGFIGLIWSLDAPTASDITRAELQWKPTGPGLIADLDAGHYFRR